MLPYPEGKRVLIIAGATECATVSAIVIAIAASGHLIAPNLAWVAPRTAVPRRIQTVNQSRSIRRRSVNDITDLASLI